jgi:hypothetical protein
MISRAPHLNNSDAFVPRERSLTSFFVVMPRHRVSPSASPMTGSCGASSTPRPFGSSTPASGIQDKPGKRAPRARPGPNYRTLLLRRSSTTRCLSIESAVGPRVRVNDGQGRMRHPTITSPLLTIFWHCGFAAFSSRTKPGCIPATNRQRFWSRIARSQGLAMLICSEKFGVREGAAQAVGPSRPAAPLPTLLIGGLLLLSCP